MTPEQYWYDDVRLIEDYAKAKRIERRQQNEDMWYQGYYDYTALGAFREILPAFPKKGAKIYPYLSAPVPLDADEKEEREEREAQKKREALRKYLMRSAKKE